MASTRRTTARSTVRKVLVSAGVVGAAAAVAGMGTFGTFTSSTSASATVNSGTVAIALGATNSAANRLSVTAANIVPGDTIARAVTLTNNGDQALATIALTTTATTSSLLDTDATNGLQLSVRACSVPYTEGGTAPAYTYTCSGTESTLVASRAVLGSAIALTSPRALAAGATDNMLVVMALPQVADNTFQGRSSTLQLAFTGTQRTGTNR